MTMTATEFSRYLRTLISEKGKSPDDDMDKPGNIGLTYDHLIEFIELNCNDEMRSNIHNTLVTIDFKNGDVFHYFNHLADGMIKAAGLDAYS